ncbi:hypothetical protein AAF712_011160 [Marasmius tenuissimus]|uniref:Uncharacterized protein n=1 Tax=Marasmius tenuissimus TaxID=585030 RepID=A0ABR2ZM49_9AGAR|nr:hypothetical protein PM082_021144 [Marasmius tenuissimus]
MGPGDTSKRANPYQSNFTPKQRSQSDFCFAAAPVLKVFRDQNPQFKRGEMAPFTAKVWDEWFKVWPEPERSRGRLAQGLEVYVTILNEATHHEEQVRQGNVSPLENTDVPWEALLDQIIGDSGFQKWAPAM